MKLNGINIQFPISELIKSGEKKIETRTYPLPEKYKNCPLLFIETPGKKGNFKSQIVGLIYFSRSFEYKDINEFNNDYNFHLVDENSEWKWKDKIKHGWIIDKVILTSPTIQAPHPRGIIFTMPIKVPTKLLSFL